MTRRSASCEARSPARGSDCRKQYRVSFCHTQYISIVLGAVSEDAAIEAAEALYVDGDSDDHRFQIKGGDVFGNPMAEEVDPMEAVCDEP
jgi:hypothetical protein